MYTKPYTYGLFTLLLLAIISLCNTTLPAQPGVRASLDSTNMLIGDHMRLRLQASLKEGQQLVRADLSNLDTMKVLDILDLGRMDTVQTQPNYILQQDITFTIFDSGSYFIPALPFQFIKKGNPVTLTTNPLVVHVNTIPVDSLALAPIKPILTESLTFEDVWPYLLAGIILLSLIFGVYYYSKSRDKKELPSMPEVIIPAHELALDKLDELEKDQLWQQGLVKEYQSKLTYIVREYIESRYNIQALESTTDQIIQYLKPVDISEAHKTKLRNLLEMADLVKFAKAIPPADIHDRELKEVRQFVLDTKLTENFNTTNELTIKKEAT